MSNKNQVIDEPLEDAPGFNLVKLIGVGSLSLLVTALLLPTLLSFQLANPITYYTKPYVETETTCFLGKLNNFYFNDQVAFKLNQAKSCLDTLVYPVNSDEYQILIRNIKAVEKLNPEELLPLEYRNIIESNLTNINLQRAEKSLDPKSDRWLLILLSLGGLTVGRFLGVLIIHQMY